MTLLLTHQPITEFVEVDWCRPNFETGDVTMTTCDFCFEYFARDLWDGKPIRRFFEILNECGLIACEHCLPNIQEPNHDRH